MTRDTRSKVREALSLRASGHTTRWHTIQHLKRQTVSEHSAQALSLLLVLHPSPSIDLIKSVLWHDSAERVVGDAPAPGLHANPDLLEAYRRAECAFFEEHDSVFYPMAVLSEEDRAWLKAVDRLELYLWCHDEIMLGNQHARVIEERALRLIQQITPRIPEIFEFVEIHKTLSFEERSFA